MPDEEVSEPVGDEGGTVSTEGGDSEDDPVSTDVTVPEGTGGGEVTIAETQVTEEEPTGFVFVGQQVDISAPDATVADPLVITFDIFTVTAGTNDPNAVTMFKAGAEVLACTGAGATPDPCVDSRSLIDGITIRVVVRTSTASPWNFGVPDANCLCQVTNITPSTITLNTVGTSGKRSSKTSRINVQITAVDAPGATCDVGESSGPQRINLKMVDDDGFVLIDSAKTVTCSEKTQHIVRNVLVQGPLNCKDSAVPDGNSVGVITATGSASGTADFVKDIAIHCGE